MSTTMTRDATQDGVTAELLRELTAIVPRFHRALVRSGTDPEYADMAVASARAAIAKAHGERS